MKQDGFKTPFGDRSGYICDGDSITCTVNGFDVIARIVRDDSSDSPDKMQDGFWPSLDPKDAGYIGDKSKATLARYMKRAQEVMQAWERDEWFYVGVIVEVSRHDVKLAQDSLWGIECNYPINRKRANRYLLDVANEVLAEALSNAEDKLGELLADWKGAA